MARIDVECADGHQHEVDRAIADWPATPPCPTCGAPTEQYHPPPRARWTLDPVVVYRAPDGTFRYPGDADGPGAAKYHRQGFERIELRSAADVRRFEHTVNDRELSRARRRVEIQDAMRIARESEMRSDLRMRMQSMSALGRDVARAAMERNDRKARPTAREAGFHIEVFSMDRSNREVARDAHGRRRRD